MKRALYSLLPIFLATASVDSPAQQESGVDGSSTTVDDTITGTAPNTLVTATVFIPAGTPWHCVATGSLEAVNPNIQNDNQYILGFNVDNAAATVAGSDRTIDFDNVGEDERTLEASSTFLFTNLAPNAFHTIYWSARKEAAADDNMTVNDSSMTVVCSDYQL